MWLLRLTTGENPFRLKIHSVLGLGGGFVCLLGFCLCFLFGWFVCFGATKRSNNEQDILRMGVGASHRCCKGGK